MGSWGDLGHEMFIALSLGISKSFGTYTLDSTLGVNLTEIECSSEFLSHHNSNGVVHAS